MPETGSCGNKIKRKPMKRILITLAIISAVLSLKAGPVAVDKAEIAGRQFVASSFAQCSRAADLQLVYTGTMEKGEPCFYVFNVGDNGFVIISADDRFRPVVGYSEEGAFPKENRSPEMMFYLDKIIEARSSTKAVLPSDAQEEWQSLLQGGKPISRNGGKDASFICETKWNQNAPYNYYAPEAASGPGGRCYAGCVATAMSQVMKQWNAPAQGRGTHSYYSSYGHLSANFGATTYNWEHMPDHISTSSSTTEEIEAVALLMYHCAIAVDMAFGPNGSGAFSEDVPRAINKFFNYSGHAEQNYRDYYELFEWQMLLKEQIDLGWPVYYGGYSNSGGHAFVCDGYDDNDMFHFNWGWGGSSDGFFVIDEIDYANWASAITCYVPADVYDYMPQCPTDFSVVSHEDTEFSATLTWTNPTKTIHDDAIDDIDSIVVCRNGDVIYTVEAPAVGETLTFTDHFLPVKASYSVYAVSHGVSSTKVVAEDVALGPTCLWSIEMTSSDAEGWQGAYVSVRDGKGVEFAQLTPDSKARTMSFNMPLGDLSFAWVKPQQAVEQLGFTIFDGNHREMVVFNGSSADLEEGTFFVVSNACDDSENGASPFNLTGVANGQDAQLQWEVKGGTNNLYFVYRDGLLYDVTSSTDFVDANTEGLFHTYKVTSFDGAVESAPSNICNVQPESNYACPSNLRWEFNAQGKLQLTWEPSAEGGETGYVVYRRPKGGVFKRIKATTSTTYADNVKILPCDFYEYAVAACYTNVDNVSSYANAMDQPELNYVSFNKTLIPTDLTYTVTEQGLALSWTEAYVAEEYALYRDGELLADHLTGNSYVDENATVDQTYCYFVVGKTPTMTEYASMTLCYNGSSSVPNVAEEVVSVYPNPACDQVRVCAKGLREVSVINLLGQVVLVQQSNEETQIIDIQHLSKGTYFLNLKCDQGNTVVKLIKNNILQ